MDPPALHPFPTRRSSDLEPLVVVERPVVNDVLAAEGQLTRAPAGRKQQLIKSGGCSLIVGDSLEKLRSEEHTSELQSPMYLVCRLLLEKKRTHRFDVARG